MTTRSQSARRRVAGQVLAPILTATLVLPLGSCTSTADWKEGAALGAMAGAAAGQIAGGDTESTILGAAIGGVLGAAIGNNIAMKREARAEAKRKATAAELQQARALAKQAEGVQREQALAAAREYQKVLREAEEKAIADADAEEVMEEARTDPGAQEEVAVESEPTAVTQAPVIPAPVAQPTEPGPKQLDAMFIPETVIVEVIELPNDQGVVLRNSETGAISEEVYEIGDITSNDESNDDASSGKRKPFTLILSDKRSAKKRSYTAIYSV